MTQSCVLEVNNPIASFNNSSFDILPNDELLERFQMDMLYSYEDLSEYTINGVMGRVRHFLKEVNKPAFTVSKNMIEQYLRNLKTASGADMVPDTKQNYLSSIKRFYNFLFNSEDVQIKRMRYYYDERGTKIDIDNPTEKIKSVNTSSAAKLLRNPRKEGLTYKETVRLIHHMEDNLQQSSGSSKEFLAYRDYAIISLMLEIGLRYTDVSNLKTTDIDLKNKEMDIVIQKTMTRKKYVLSEKLCNIIKKYLHLRRFLSSPFLFVSECGNQIDNSSMNKMIAKHAKKADISRPVSCHILRHTCGALTYAETKDLALVKEILCHSTVSTTQRYVYSEDLINDIGFVTENITNRLHEESNRILK